jgi:hypothetical protein
VEERMVAPIVPGPTGHFSEDPIAPGDRGDCGVVVDVDLGQKAVVINFGTELSWIGMKKKDAIAFAKIIFNQAKRIPD